MHKRATLLALLFAPAVAHAAAFQINDQHARATGRGDAYIANPHDAAAVYFNPAGIGNLEGFNFSVGANLILPRAEFKQDGTNRITKASASVFTIPNLYASYRINNWVGVGIGLFPTFGLGIKWPQNSPARTITREQQVTSFTISPVVAINLSQVLPGVTLAVGPDLVPASLYLLRDISFGSQYGSVEAGGTAFGAGARAGLTIQPQAIKGLSFGFFWRSQTRLDFKGKVNFTAPSPYRSELPPDGNATTRLTLPMSFSGGVSYAFFDEKLEIEADVTWTEWSSVRELQLVLPGNVKQTLPKNYRDQVALRAGLEYALTDAFSLRMGIIWDQYAVPASTLDYGLPDTDRTSLTFGLGYAFLSNMLRADFGANFILPTRRRPETTNANLQGEFSVNAIVLGLSVSGHFGGKK